MFGATNIVKIKKENKERWVYSSYAIAFDWKGDWNFGNDFARNVIIFGLDKSSLSHTNNRINYFLILVEEDTLCIKWIFGAPEKTFIINFSKAKTTFCLGLRCNGHKSYALVNGKISLSSKQIIKMSTFQINFV